MTNEWFDLEQFQTIWQELINLLPAIHAAAEQGVERHIDVFNDVSDHEIKERALMKDIFTLVQKKWMLNIVNALAFHEKLYFNEIKNHLGRVSSKTLSERLKELVKLRIITRVVEDEYSPIRVYYFLTEFGQGLHHSFLPFVIHYFTFKKSM